MPSTERGTRYREIKRLGAGGMATVTLAEDTVLGRPVALKRVYRTGDRRHMLRLKREAMIGASLNHPNLVFVYDAQLQEDGDVVIIMEHLEGAAPSPAMDVYALAAMAYEMLAGEKARPGSNPLALAHAIATQPPPDLRRAWPAAPAAAAAVLQRGMSSDPAQRPASAGELVRRLEAALEPERPTRVVAGAPPPTAGQPRRRRSLLAPALLGLVALAVAV